MKKVDNENNENEDLMMGQKSLLEKVIKINKLFRIHFCSLSLFLACSITSTIILMYSILTGQFIPTLVQRYALFGIVFTVLQLTVLNLMFIYLIFQISVYFSFVIRGNRSIKRIEQSNPNNDNLQSILLHHGIVSYINNISTFFNRYSKEKTKLSDLVTIFLYMNFFFGYLIIFIYSSLGGIGDSTVLAEPFSAILFLALIISWLISFGTSFKIHKNILIWDKIIPKLDTWAQEIEDLPSNTSNKPIGNRNEQNNM